MNDGFESYDSKMHHEKMARLYRIHGDDIFEIVDRMYVGPVRTKGVKNGKIFCFGRNVLTGVDVP